LESLPGHIVITCSHCGHANVFEQLHPYNAGYAGQGFLYNETGDCTLIWSSSDPEYVTMVGRKPPWTLSAAEQRRMEDRLLQAPDGTRWLFKNPARCGECHHPLSGPMTETVYYLRYDGSLDRDSARHPGPGLKDVLRPKGPVVPWTTRDVWLGVLVALLVVAAAYGLAYGLRALSVTPNVDLWVALVPTLFELLFLVPVWWFAVRKYHASFRTLGFVKFKPSVVAEGIGLLFAFYIFNGIYAALLSQFGLGVQKSLAPLFHELSTPWPLFISVVLVAPFAEETFFRGFVFAGLRTRYRWPWAAAISAALFAAAHAEITFFIPAFLLGYLFAYLYQRSGSIWPGMILHVIVNGLGLTLAFLRV
jgi:uncharacterized protein